MEILENAVVVRGVCKQYERDSKVLNNLNVTVKKGTIYALLGASGCGKTTLLGAIVGSRVIQKGAISILGQQPGVVPVDSIGFMPQETALLGELNVKNALQYQGYIFGLTDKQINAKYTFLEELLDLPPGDQLVRNLSGGQQRRLSLAVVLITDPELLILDEPTVGLDPILRQHLWDYLTKITQEDKKTVIITTHYLEEAKQAHTIGLLRNGKILSEGEPDALLREHDCTTIENMFALLSSQQEEVDISVDNQENQYLADIGGLNVNTTLPKKTLLDRLRVTNKNHARALMFKNLIRLIRNPGLLIIAFGLPILQLSFFFLSIGVVPNDMKIGIVNEELNNYTDCKQYIMDNKIGGEILDDNETCVYYGLGCMFIEKIGKIKDIPPIKVYFKSEDEAFNAMKKGQFHYILHVPHNYSESVTVTKNMAIFVGDEDLDESNFQHIHVYRDVQDWTLGVLIEKELYKTYLRFAEKLATDCGSNKLSEKWPMNFKNPIYGDYDHDYGDYTAPAIIVLVTTCLTLGLALFTTAAEKNNGIWERNLVSGITTLEILLFDTIINCIIAFIEFIEIFITSFYIFNVYIKGSLFYVFFLIYLQSLVGLSLGTLISVSARSMGEAIFIGTGIFVPLIAISGGFWPLEGMPTFLRYISYLAPPAISTESLRYILYRGWDITYYDVGKGFLTSTGFVLVYSIFSVVVLKFSRQ